MRPILVPNLTDWTQTGKILARLAGQYGYEQIGRGRLTNDAPIAMSATRVGGDYRYRQRTGFCQAG